MDILLKSALSSTRIVPALRGITVSEVQGVVETLMQFGISVFEIPLRTKDPAFSPVEAKALEAIRILALTYGHIATIVAGTVTSDRDLDILQDLGVSTCFSLNLQTELVQLAVARNMTFIPGVETITEAIEATRAGAAGLKLFPAVMREPDGRATVRLTPGYVSYLSRFISLPIIPAGNAFDNGIVGDYLRAGAVAVNVGAQLYQPGISLEALRTRLNELFSQINPQ